MKIKKYMFFAISLMMVDFIFSILLKNSLGFSFFLRVFLFDLAVSLMVTFLTSRMEGIKALISDFAVLMVFSIYALVQLQFRNFLGTCYSFQALADGGFRVGTMMGYFFKSMHPSLFLCLIPPFGYLMLNRFFAAEINDKPVFLLGAILSVVVLALSVFSANEDVKYLFKTHSSFDSLLKEEGISQFLIDDIISVFRDTDEDLETIETVIAEEENTIDTAEEVDESVEPLKRVFDDSLWIDTASKEENPDIRMIDEYLLSRNITDKNEVTGIYKDCNFIYFLVESLDYMAIDPILTPTIYRMYTQGYSFSGHYTPVFTCGTGDGELVSMTSLMPFSGTCTVYKSTELNLHNSLAGLFKNAGYSTYSFHNWDDQFYERTKLHQAYGIDEYRDINSLNIPLVQGWQSDEKMIEDAMQYFIEDDHFFAFFVTSTMHWPYTEYSYYGDYYMAEIDAVHPEYPMEVKRYLSKSMEFDHALKKLLEELEAAGKLSNTVICFWPDHHPLNMEYSYIEDYSIVMDRAGDYGIYKSPFVIYSVQGGERVDNICSTFDHLPTVANMFDLDYDPRMYVGKDIFAKDGCVIFPDGTWISDYGIRYGISGIFVNRSGLEYNEENIERVTAEVRNITKVSRAMLSTDYFRKRESVLYPKDENR